MYKKSAKPDGRKSKKDANPALEAAKAAAGGGGGSKDGQPTGTFKDGKPQCSKIVDGPGGVKWEIFEDCAETDAADAAAADGGGGCSIDGDGCSAPPKGAPTPPSPPAPPPYKYVPKKSKIIDGPGGAKWEIFMNDDGTWPNTEHP